MKYQLLLVFLLNWFTLIENKNYNESITVDTPVEERLWGGMSTNTGNNYGGWLVRLVSGGSDIQFCVGSYYAPNVVLSSANCMDAFRYQSEDACAMTIANTEEEEFYFSVIEAIYIPEDFILLKTWNDIALVRLIVPLRGDLTEFIKLSFAPPVQETVYFTFGWGYDSMEVQPPSPDLRLSRGLGLDLKFCQQMFTPYYISNSNMCAYFPKDRLKCVYDGGSPLVYNNQLWGVASIGAGCKYTKTPGIYTSLRAVRKFIEETTKEIMDEELEYYQEDEEFFRRQRIEKAERDIENRKKRIKH